MQMWTLLSLLRPSLLHIRTHTHTLTHSHTAYLTQVQEQIKEYTGLALECKRLGDLALAKRALVRVRRMRAELAEVAEAEGQPS